MCQAPSGNKHVNKPCNSCLLPSIYIVCTKTKFKVNFFPENVNWKYNGTKCLSFKLNCMFKYGQFKHYFL